MSMNSSDPRLKALARMIAETCDLELTCDELLDRVARYVETLKKRETPDDTLALVEKHLRLCPECREELIALLRAEGVDPGSVGISLTDD